MAGIEIIKREGGYDINRIDDWDERWPYGELNLWVQDEGTDDELRGYEGYVDTKYMAFSDEESIIRHFKRICDRCCDFLYFDTVPMEFGPCEHDDE